MTWHDYFTYEPETGNLIWKERPREWFSSDGYFVSWNKQNKGKVAGSIAKKRNDNGFGYIHVCVRGKAYKAHRVIWEMMNGPIPKGMVIDHINGNGTDNRISNIRLATNSQNGMNRAASKNNKLGLKGVVAQARTKKFLAYIAFDGVLTRIGSYNTKGLAALAYAKESMKRHGAFARTSKTNAIF